MRIITALFVVITLVLSMWICSLVLDTRLLNGRIEQTEQEITSLKQESINLVKYRKETPLSLDKFYLGVFNDIKEVCLYYHADCELNIIGSKDFVSTREFFKKSQYKGVRYLDILCRVGQRDQFDMYLFDVLFKMLAAKPIEILEVRLEKNNINLIMRLFGY